MAKKKKRFKYYAAHCRDGGGGVYETFEELKEIWFGVKKVQHQGFQSYEEAWCYAFPGIPVPEKEDAKGPLLDKSVKSSNCDGSLEVMIKPLSNSDIPLETSVIQFCDLYNLSYLSEQQKKAIQSVKGKTLLFAVPGSGKTTVIISRVGYMIHSCNIPSSQIMSLTFTKAAAVEMKKRYIDKFNNGSVPDFRTIHSLCFSRILPELKRDGFHCERSLIGSKQDSTDEKVATSNTVFKELFKELKCPNGDFELALESAQAVITGIKNTRMPWKEYENRTVKINNKQIGIPELYETYERILSEHNLMDFDDLLIYSFVGLKEHPKVLNDLRNRYRYWNVDEAQDNSKIQFDLIDLICNDDRTSLFMVGDDDQSIFSFRGANPSLLREFGSRDNVVTLLMDTNYRSDYNIVNTAKAFIEENKNRAPKELKAKSNESGIINIPNAFKNEALQYSMILSACKEVMPDSDSGDRKKRLAILYRRNVSALPLIVHFHKNGISYESNKALSEILNERQIRPIWRILKYINTPNSLKYFLDCNVYFKIYLRAEEKKALKKLHETYPKESILELLKAKYEESDDTKTQIEDLKKAISFVEDTRFLKPSAAIKEIIFKIQPNTIDSVGDRLRIYSLISACDIFDSIPSMMEEINEIITKEKHIEKGEDSADRDNYQDSVKTADEPMVTLSTFHSAKGREFGRVILIDLFDEIMPGEYHDNALIYDEEEERRLFYVAITRAIHRLDIITTDKYHGNSEIISRFVKEFAFICDTVCSSAVTIKRERISAPESEEIVLEPTKYYGVKVGRNPGVYTTWSECERQIFGFSDAKHESFGTKEEAEAYVGITDTNQLQQYDLSELEGYYTRSGGHSFNHPMDLPSIITSILNERLESLDQKKILKLQSQSNYMFVSAGKTDYSDSIDAYVFTYLPVNFYKVWKPLWDLVKKKELPQSLKVLELGAGPGTATLGLISFYIMIAKGNPKKEFVLDITAVEREKEFGNIFNKLTTSLVTQSPDNLKTKIHLIQEDAFSFRINEDTVYDMVLESNMLNSFEEETNRGAECFVQTVRNALGGNGYVIMIEPGRKDNLSVITEIISDMQKKEIAQPLVTPIILSTAVSKISTYQKTVDMGLRGKMKAEHWFSYTVMKRGVRDDS